jgi:hypothetical protein
LQFIAVTNPHNKEDIRREIRRYRAKFYSHQQIIDTLHIPERTYYYHWNIIKTENKQVYDKLTEENIREDIERTIAGLEQKIQELQGIIDNKQTENVDRIRAIESQSQMMAAIPRMRQEGGAFIATIEPGHTDTRKQEEVSK